MHVLMYQAFEESLLQWKQQQCKQKANGDGHVVVNQSPVNSTLASLADILAGRKVEVGCHWPHAWP